jgi:hypothetical protein
MNLRRSRSGDVRPSTRSPGLAKSKLCGVAAKVVEAGMSRLSIQPWGAGCISGPT